MLVTNQDTTIPGAALFGELQKNWGWLLALGILFVILGAVGLGMTFALTLASVVVFGVLLLIGGGVQLVDAFKFKGWKSILWHLLIALAYGLAGIAIITDPLLASTFLTAMLAGAIVGVGFLRIIMAFQSRGSQGWGWLLLAGIVSILLGVLIFARWPVSALWVIGLLVAIEMIMHGWSYIFLALAARDAGKAQPTETAGAATGSA